MDNIEKLQNEIKKLEARREELFKLKEPIDEELVSSYNKIEKLKNKIDKIVLTSDNVNWNYLLDAETGMESYKECSERLCMRGLYGPCGAIKNKRCFQIMLYKDKTESLAKTYNGLIELLPYLDYNDFDDYKSYKFVDIFEYTLSENGSYYCLINEERNEYILMQDKWRITNELKRFTTLMSMLEYIQENHYYE